MKFLFLSCLNLEKLLAWNSNIHLSTFLTAHPTSTSNIELCWVTTKYLQCLQVKWPLSWFKWQWNAIKAECDLCRSLSCFFNNRAWPVIMSEWQWLILKVLTKCYNITWVFGKANGVIASSTGVLSTENRWYIKKMDKNNINLVLSLLSAILQD